MGLEEEEVDAPEWRGFWDGVNLCLGAIVQTNTRKKERERERQSEKYQQHNIDEYKELKVRMHENTWTCDMQTKIHHGFNPIQTYQHTSFQQSKYTSKCMKHCYNTNVMQCMIF